MFRIVIGKNTEAVFIFYGRFLVQAAALNSVNEAVEIYITKGGHKKGLHSTGFFWLFNIIDGGFPGNNLKRIKDDGAFNRMSCSSEVLEK